MKKYWLVHRRGTQTHYMHPTREEAETEAKRLAALQPGAVFNVLECVCGAKVSFPQPEIFNYGCLIHE